MRQGSLFGQWYDKYIGKPLYCHVGMPQERIIKDFLFKQDPHYPKHITVAFEGTNGKQGFLSREHFENYYKMVMCKDKNK